jgi:hypothetical protein
MVSERRRLRTSGTSTITCCEDVGDFIHYMVLQRRRIQSLYVITQKNSIITLCHNSEDFIHYMESQRRRIQSAKCVRSQEVSKQKTSIITKCYNAENFNQNIHRFKNLRSSSWHRNHVVLDCKCNCGPDNTEQNISCSTFMGRS